MTLDTIGHVGRRPDDFEGLLVQHSVRSVADFCATSHSGANHDRC